MNSDQEDLPLRNLRVLDLSRVLAGPYCTMILGDLGADVIKVENPAGGDDTRTWGPPEAGGEAAYYLSINRNKRSIALDLATAEGRAVLGKLVARADVVVENFRAGTMDRWGLGYEWLKEKNPGLIYCAISGYGPIGPEANTPGYDFVLQAGAGLMSITGEPGGSPQKLGVAIADLLTGLMATIGVLGALAGRDLGGEKHGRRIDVSLFESSLAALINVGQNYLVNGRDAGRYGNSHPNIVPYQLFAAADGWITLAVGNDRQFRAAARALGHEEWTTDPRFSSNPARVANRDSLVGQIAAILAERPLAQWLQLFHAADVPVGPVQTVADALDSPQAQALGIVQEVEHPTVGRLRMVGSPLRLDGKLPPIKRPPPLLGEHTAEVLAELGEA